MQVQLAYRGRSGVTSAGGGDAISFAANLARDRVAFAGDLLHPLRFRELFSALHEVVVSDLRVAKKDRSAHLAWKQAERNRAQSVYHQAHALARKQLEQRAERPMPPGLEAEFHRQHHLYWQARRSWSNQLMRDNQALWAKLRPCDPVVTVADDQVLFECFSTDESSYAALGVDRDAFAGGADAAYGTTNVDYSWDLYEHIQGLRNYRPTRFAVAPEGIAVQVGEAPAYHEEKIDLPPSWLRGFAQIGAAATLPVHRIPITPAALYAVLAWLKRHRERASPRALRIQALSGKPVRITLEPWEQEIVAEGATWSGPDLPPIRVWGRRRLMTLARVLPLIDRVELHLLGTGMPWFVVARCGEMRFTLGLSGWTTNDWTRSAALDLLAPPAVPEERELVALADELHRRRHAGFTDLGAIIAEPARLAAALTHLAGTGQVVHDLAGDRYRWRQVVPRALGEAEKGPDHPELVAARDLLRRGAVTGLAAKDKTASGTLMTAEIDGKACELLLDRDGRMKKAKCGCDVFRKGGLKVGPCRHLLALRLTHQQRVESLPAAVWSLGRR